MSENAYSSRVLIVHEDHPDVAFPAHLSWSPGATTTLVCDIVPDPLPTWFHSKRVERLHVVSPDQGTLFDVLCTGSKHDAGGSVYTFQPAWALFGGVFTGSVPKFAKLSIEADGCGSWFGISGFRHIAGLENVAEGITIDYKPVKTEFWPVAGGWSAGYGVNVDFHRERHPNEGLTIDESPAFTVMAPESAEPNDLMRMAMKAMSFVEFATDEVLWIDRVHVSDGAETQRYEMNASWKQERIKRRGVHWLFPYKIVEENFGAHLAKWFSLYEALPLALDLYRVCKRSSSLQVEFRLFSMISALESLHRSLYGEGPVSKCPTCKRKAMMSLEQRLQDMVKRHGASFQGLLSKKDCKLVADTRNYLAHQTPELAAKASPPEDWYNWYRRLTMVFEMCVLSELPFAHPDAFRNLVAGRWEAIKSGSLGDWNLGPTP